MTEGTDDHYDRIIQIHAIPIADIGMITDNRNMRAFRIRLLLLIAFSPMLLWAAMTAFDSGLLGLWKAITALPNWTNVHTGPFIPALASAFLLVLGLISVAIWVLLKYVQRPFEKCAKERIFVAAPAFKRGT
jgi:hypothetical protein